MRILLFLFVFLSAGMTAVSVRAGNVFSAARVEEDGKWVTASAGVRYKYGSGKYAKNVWLKISGKVYYINKKKYRETGWFTYKKHTYYADKEGAVLKKAWVKEGKAVYYLGSDGIRIENVWKKIKGNWYHFKKNGKMSKNCFVDDCFVAKNGVRLSNTWVILKSGARYYVGKDGKRLKKIWLKSGGRFYYLKKSGKMAVSQWITCKDGIYYVNERGARVANCIVDGYYLNSKGKRAFKAFTGSYIFVGDSRFVGMEMSVGSSEDSLYIAKVSMGYTWLSGEAGPKLKDYLTAWPDVKVILGLGINDLGNADRYVSYYNDLIRSFPDTKFYLLAVNPVVESKWKTVKNSVVRQFNAKIKANVSAAYIDSYSYLTKKGFSTVDGLHYTAATYKVLHQYILKKVK